MNNAACLVLALVGGGDGDGDEIQSYFPLLLTVPDNILKNWRGKILSP